ncbi:MAG: phospholipase D-like domain-containing protein [Clostridiales bacterium]|nr:phospholipase D-like domain-containing protein [Clostridiales bacterium]
MVNKLAGSGGKENWKREYFSIPNLMGYFRILLVPVFAVLYLRAETSRDYLVATVVLGISALTDCFDGKIARRFNMVTEWGKFIDPLADKLTQCVAALCLTTRFPLMVWLAALLLFKELVLAILGAVFLHMGKKMDGAQWCGKVATVILDCSLVILLLLPDISYSTANLLIYLCMAAAVYALIGYGLVYRRMWLDIGQEKGKKHGWRIGILSGAGLLVLFVIYVLVGAILPVSKQKEVSEDYQSSFSVDDFYSEEASGDRATLLMDNEDALESRIRMIAAAQERIILSTFDIRSDEAGMQVLSALYAAAERGVAVQLLADGMRSLTNMEGNPYFYALSSHENVEIRIYNQINLLKPWTIMGRLHDKYIIVDDDLYLLGGRNTFDYFLGDTDGWRNFDWDVLVYYTGQGEGSMAQLEAYFETVWDSENCTVFHNSARLANTGSVKRAAATLTEVYAALQEEQPELFTAYDYEANTVETDKITLLSGDTNIFSKESKVYYAVCQLMENAEENVSIHTPYVICNDAMTEEFGTLSSLVPSVQLMTNSPANNSNPFGAAYYQADRLKVVEQGITLLEYHGDYSYHGKVIAIDDDLSLVGSFNFDMRSVYLDTELMLAVDSEDLNAMLREDMAYYEAQAATVVDEDTTVLPNGEAADQSVSPIRQVVLSGIRLLLGWAKFLM